MIDPHVHLRDWNEERKETMVHAFRVAWESGLSGVFEMPNTDPPLTSERTIRKRIVDADRARKIAGVPIFHGIYAGMTTDPIQIAEMVALYDRLFPRIVGFKLFTSHSTGGMGILDATDQYALWRTLAQRNYTGVVAIHAESHELLRPDLIDPLHPATHGTSRPAAAEVDAVARQISFATDAGFLGSVHFCHISTPEAVEIVTDARGQTPFTLRLGVTPHHVLLDQTVAERSDSPEWTVNPPLRDPRRQKALWNHLLAGNIDWIESDHAPHQWTDKVAGAAGLPGIPPLRLLRDRLRELVDNKTLHELTHRKIVDAFAIPDHHFPINDHLNIPYNYKRAAQEYSWDPYRYLT